jgi:hypothetical protein
MSVGARVQVTGADVWPHLRDKQGTVSQVLTDGSGLVCVELDDYGWCWFSTDALTVI